jgi:CO dehydrogenase maturation factor
MKISVCGKGGSGKTVITTLLARVLRDRGYRVLVVDSDESNSGLHRLLGFSLQSAVGTNVLVQDQVGLRDLPPLYVVERDGISLVAVGKILQSLEGCACPMGVLSREFLRKLHLREDEVAIVDMEAGVEHFGRGVEASIDSVIIVVDPSLESLELAERVSSMTAGIGVRNTWALLNKVTSDEIASTLRQELRQRNVDVVGFVRYDPQVFEACLTGLPVQSGEAARDVEAVVDAVLAARAT